MKKLLLALPVLFVLNGCVAPNTNTSTTPSTSQQLGVTALKVAVNAKCMSEINTLPAWKTATKLLLWGGLSYSRSPLLSLVCS